MSSGSKLEVEEAEAGGTRVFRLRGVLTDSHEGFAFLERVREVGRQKAARVVLNLRHVDLMTSAGVGIIAACYTSAINAGGTFALAELQPRPRMVLHVVRLLTLIQAFDTEQAALSALAGAPPS